MKDPINIDKPHRDRSDVTYFQNGSIRVQEVDGGIKVTFIDANVSVQPRATNSVILKEIK